VTTADGVRGCSDRCVRSDRDVIDAAGTRRMSYLQGCCNGSTAAAAEHYSTSFSSARLQLLNPGSKTQYDNELRAADTCPFADPLPRANRQPISRRFAIRSPVIRSGPVNCKRVSARCRWFDADRVPSLLSLAIAWKSGCSTVGCPQRRCPKKTFLETLSPSNPSTRATFDRGFPL